MSLWKRLLISILAGFAILPVARAEIGRIDIFNLSHMDIGFTDHPAVTREMQRSYIDLALDACAANPEFRWTTESLLAVTDWWEAAPAPRREQLLAAIARGQIAIAALPLNNAPTLDRDEWLQMLQWVPEDLWRRLHPNFAIQDDVNGFPRAGAMQLLNHGIHRLFMGMNSDSGGPPFPVPPPSGGECRTATACWCISATVIPWGTLIFTTVTGGAGPFLTLPKPLTAPACG